MGLIRLILALSVVITHAGDGIFGAQLVGGKIAVQSFYIISGFYMTLILNEKYVGQNGSYKLFITNRLLRLYPVYWVVLLLTVAVSLTLFVSSSGENYGKLAPYAQYYESMNFSSLAFLIVANIVLLFQDVVMFLGLDLSNGNLFFTSNFYRTNPMLWKFLLVPQAWTIGIEICFYLIAPFIVRRKLSVIAILIMLSFALRLGLYQNGFYHDPWTYRFFPNELLFFLLGTLGYHMYIKLKTYKLSPRYLQAIYAFILLITFVYSFVPWADKYILYLFIFFLSVPFIFLLSKNWKRDRYIGELSYPVYISHWFVIWISQVLNVSYFGVKGIVISLMTIFISILLNELVSKKVERYRQSRVKNIQNS